MTMTLLWLLLLPLNQQDQVQAINSNETAAADASKPAKAAALNSDAPTGTAAIKPAKPAAQQNKTSNDRLFFALPNFFTLENASDAPPMTVGEKFKTTARGSFDPMEVGFYGVQAGISQLAGHDSSYGQGVEGYAERLAVRFGDSTIENFMTRAIVPSILHEDPRFFQKGSGGFWHRTSYAVTRIFVTRTDSGSETFNFSEIVGAAGAAGISAYSYHPESAHNIGSAASIAGSQVGYDALSYWLKEFWPDIRHKLSKHHAVAAMLRSGAE